MQMLYCLLLLYLLLWKCVFMCISCIYEWSLVLPCDSALKRAVDFVLCSLCYIQSNCVFLLLEWMGIVSDISDTVADTDDVKGCHRNQPLTDDVKADGASVHLRQNMLAAVPLHTAQLATLAVACQSLLALRKLIDSGIVSALCNSLYVTCHQKLNDALNATLLVSESEAATSDAARSGVNSQTDDSSVSDMHSGKRKRCCVLLCLTVIFIILILFYIDFVIMIPSVLRRCCLLDDGNWAIKKRVKTCSRIPKRFFLGTRPDLD